MYFEIGICIGENIEKCIVCNFGISIGENLVFVLYFEIGICIDFVLYLEIGLDSR